MPYVSVMAPCLVCRMPFTFHPNLVPSFDAGRGREPICAVCLDRVNAKRRELGNPEIVPHPRAYEAAEESEVDFG